MVQRVIRYVYVVKVYWARNRGYSMSLEKEFSQVPSLRPLLIKGAFAKGSGAASLPAMRRTLKQVEIQASHLKAYNKVCGFKDRAVIPPTYLHMFVFPMFMDMFVDSAFPFKVMGAVHVRNTITQHRQIRCSEFLDLSCQLQNLQEVDKGFEFDVYATAHVGDELVWESTITNMSITKKGGAKKDKQREAMDWSAWNAQSLRAGADIGRQYAKVSGDYNPIHLYNATAKLLGFKKAIAHGMWTKAACLAKLNSLYADKQAFHIDVKFKLPVFLPATLNLFSSTEQAQTVFHLRDQKTDKPHLEATITIK